jgi:hypothetical protein
MTPSVASAGSFGRSLPRTAVPTAKRAAGCGKPVASPGRDPPVSLRVKRAVISEQAFHRTHSTRSQVRNPLVAGHALGSRASPKPGGRHLAPITGMRRVSASMHANAAFSSPSSTTDTRLSGHGCRLVMEEGIGLGPKNGAGACWDSATRWERAPAGRRRGAPPEAHATPCHRPRGLPPRSAERRLCPDLPYPFSLHRVRGEACSEALTQRSADSPSPRPPKQRLAPLPQAAAMDNRGQPLRSRFGLKRDQPRQAGEHRLSHLKPNVGDLGAVAGVPAKRARRNHSGSSTSRRTTSRASGRLTKSSSVAVASATVALRESRARRKRASGEPAILCAPAASFEWRMRR